MTLDHVRVAVDWAAAEGWNPGLEDAEAFHAIDPGSFLMGWLGDTPVSAISVVRHSETFGFLGYYLCKPEYRGRGHGVAIWRAGLELLGTRTVGLDGVPAQEQNYRRSGFEFAFRSHRFEGEVDGCSQLDVGPANPEDLGEILRLDAAVNGVSRANYLIEWVRQTATRQTLVFRQGGRIAAMGTIRRCRAGHKIGPLIAPDLGTADGLVRSLAAANGARQIAIDIPETSRLGSALVQQFDLKSSFDCARMYRGSCPKLDIGLAIGLASFELG